MAKLTVNALFRTGDPATLMTRIATFQDFYFSGLLLAFSVAVRWGSLTAPAPDPPRDQRVCFSTLDAAYRRENRTREPGGCDRIVRRGGWVLAA